MDKLTVYLISFFFIVGGIDYVLGSPLKIGNKFEEGIKTMGALGLGMIGIYSLAPSIAKVIAVIVPLCKKINLDPSIFPSTILAVDMGGYQIASKLALTKQMGLFSGIIIASSLGATISFSIPVALGLIKKEDQKYFSQGIMLGIIAIPIGCFIAGLYEKINIGTLIWNLLPIIIFASLLSIGLLKLPAILIKAFNLFGKIIVGLSVIGLLLQGLKIILGIQILSGLASFSEVTVIVAKIAFILAGAYPMLEIINRLFKKSFESIGEKFKINSASIAGLLGNLASNLLIFGTFDKMNPKGKVICTACGVSGAFVFGGQFGFVSGVAPQMLSPFIISKLSAGLISILLAAWWYEFEQNKLKEKADKL